MSKFKAPAAPTEAKVKASTGGAGLGAALGGALVWAIDTYVHTPGIEGDLPVAPRVLLLALAAAIVAYASGWQARHTPRPPDPDAS